MKASVGDRIIIVRPNLHEPARDGEVIEVAHADGRPPYLVRWADSARPSLIFPGPDTRIVHYSRRSAG